MEPLIAIIDDDKAVREALQRMLRSYGLTVATFDSAETFLGSSELGCASCLIADVRLPGMTGLALHECLTARGIQVPTILITAGPTAAERQRAISIGAASYLAKPLSEQILLDTVRDALDNSAAIGSSGPTSRSAPRA